MIALANQNWLNVSFINDGPEAVEGISTLHLKT